MRRTGVMVITFLTWRIEAPLSLRRAITAKRQNHCHQAEPVGNALAFAVQLLTYRIITLLVS